VTGEHCPREAETIREAWAHGDAGPLEQAHLAECPSCREIAELATAFHEEREAACSAAHLPSAGLVWWRAERRAREEAARKAASPISFVHGIALGCAAAALVAIVGLAVSGGQAWLADWWTALAWPSLSASTALRALSGLPAGLLLVMAPTLVLAPVALYLALSEK
jgi:predicted anti-sigma-YlaC factor YlaD